MTATLEALLAAGYRPTVFKHVLPPYFLEVEHATVATLDPFNYYRSLTTDRQDWCCLLACARILCILRRTSQPGWTGARWQLAVAPGALNQVNALEQMIKFSRLWFGPFATLA